MRVLVTGASGLVGSALVPRLERDGDRVWRLVRRPTRGAHEIQWGPEAGRLEPAALEGFDAIVHLAGEGLTSGRWTSERKRRIRDSRILGTRLLVRAIARLQRPPRVLVSASAIGYYGDRGDEPLSEASGPGRGFLADLAGEWESEAQRAAAAGVRVVCCRTGLALARNGGALGRLLLPFRLGLGGPLGDGRAWWSWIALDDLVEVYRFALARDSLGGAINAVAPQAVTNSEFTRALGRVLSRPTLLPLPATALRLLLGEVADEVLLVSARVRPERLRTEGFAFRFSELEVTLRHLLGSPARVGGPPPVPVGAPPASGAN